jgi:hypothetical protein
LQRHLIIAATIRMHTKAKLIVEVAAIVGLYADLVYVIWQAGHLLELALFAVLLGLYHLERNPKPLPNCVDRPH